MPCLSTFRQRLAAIALVSLGSAALTGAGSGAAATTLASWEAPQYSYANTNYNTAETTLGPANVASLKQKYAYSFTAGALGLSNILSVGTTQYVEYDTLNAAGTQYSEHVVAINLAKNKTKWTSTTLVGTSALGGQPGPIASHNGIIYASAYDHLDAINATTGAVLWSYTPAHMSNGVAVEAVANGIVYLRDGIAQQTIDAVNASTGALKWSFTTGENVQDAAYSAGMLYIGSGDGGVYAVNATTGVQKWRQNEGGVPFVAVAGTALYVSYDGYAIALQTKNGHEIWVQKLTAYDQTPMMIGGGDAVFSDGWDLQALSLTSNGMQQWDDFGGTAANCSPTGANGVVYCADHTGNLVAYSEATGQTLWSTALPSAALDNPIVVNGCLYVGAAASGQDKLLEYCT